MQAKGNTVFDLKHYAPAARVFAQCLGYSIAVGLVAHVMDPDTPFLLMMLCSLCFGFSEIIPVQKYALRTRGIFRKLLCVAIGTLIGTAGVWLLTEVFFRIAFVPADLVPCFAGGMFFGVIYLGWATHQKKQARIKRLLQNTAARKRHAEEALELYRYRLLAAQIKPHFVINALTDVLALMKNDAGRAEHLLTSLTEHLQNVLELSLQPEIPLSAELETAENYLNVEGARSPNLTYEIDVPEEMTHVRIPPFVILTLVENAVRHDAGTSSGAGNILVQGTISGRECHILVIENGANPPLNGATAPVARACENDAHRRGAEPARADTARLDAVRRQIASIYGEECGNVRLHQRANGIHGTEARLTLPFAAPSPPPANSDREK